MKRSLLLVAAVALVASACGGSAGADEGVASLDGTESPDAPAATAATELDREEALFAFTACMREHGIDVADPTVDAEGNVQLVRPGGGQEDPDFDREAVRAAREACAEHLEGAALGFRNEDRTEIEDQLLEFASCMRDNGYDMPDPDFSNAGPGQGGGPFGGFDREDPAYQEAQEACSDILSGLPGRAGGGPGGGGPGRGPGS